MELVSINPLSGSDAEASDFIVVAYMCAVLIARCSVFTNTKPNATVEMLNSDLQCSVANHSKKYFAHISNSSKSCAVGWVYVILRKHLLP